MKGNPFRRRACLGDCSGQICILFNPALQQFQSGTWSEYSGIARCSGPPSGSDKLSDGVPNEGRRRWEYQGRICTGGEAGLLESVTETRSDGSRCRRWVEQTYPPLPNSLATRSLHALRPVRTSALLCRKRTDSSATSDRSLAAVWRVRGTGDSGSLRMTSLSADPLKAPFFTPADKRHYVQSRSTKCHCKKIRPQFGNIPFRP